MFKLDDAQKAFLKLTSGLHPASNICATCDAGRSVSVRLSVKERGSATQRLCSFPVEQALMLDVDYGSYPVSFRPLGLRLHWCL